MFHAHAPLTSEARRRLGALIIGEGWSIRRAAERSRVSPATAQKWSAQYRDGLSLTDRSSHPHTCPNRLPEKPEHRIFRSGSTAGGARAVSAIVSGSPARPSDGFSSATVCPVFSRGFGKRMCNDRM
ncbi:leucine zipper domain-containing protein [Leucobacter sp. Z1108]|uniref:leucine zipper domain-containing protein n=1 Tax=Leucobacter sp. Z1108 TaxID=3439066 RepID=UPI003F3C4FCF